MNLSNYTIRAQEVVQQAQQQAFNQRNPNIETEHLLLALLEQKDSPVEYLLKKNNVGLALVDTKLKELVNRLPKTDAEPAQSLGRDANQALLRAGSLLKGFGDEFVTPEQLGARAVFMCSDAAAQVRGVAWNMDGGWVAQ
jgi:ATP-dependent Clp protease ATP-binding subunit ClpB